ncbi:MAG: hypothetical protein AVDCRST_MAG93-5338 [uncultured Chloroflexia bacterium]|uniref:Uncharacterized protein n=1 Tax=uncultured Chloroflexia bacterium TaxID=1672391 RepID=A0A6J4KR37_9CHLR|nr:MAG: hypothetical protein AVDCRST_MAG93-5338 [uncultured Chloroflexia bacterium]
MTDGSEQVKLLKFEFEGGKSCTRGASTVNGYGRLVHGGETPEKED